MRKKTVAVTWMDGTQETYATYGSVEVSATEVIITSESYERDLPGGDCRRIPLGERPRLHDRKGLTGMITGRP